MNVIFIALKEKIPGSIPLNPAKTPKCNFCWFSLSMLRLEKIGHVVGFHFPFVFVNTQARTYTHTDRRTHTSKCLVPATFH